MASLSEAQALLEKAALLSPDFADAQALLAIVLGRKLAGFNDPDEPKDEADAQKAVDAAQAVSPRDPLVLAARGLLAWVNQHCDQAEYDFRLVLTLDPNSIQALLGLAACKRSRGQMSDMIGLVQTALRLDPTSARTSVRQNLVGLGWLMLGQPVKALDWLNRAKVSVSPSEASTLTLSSVEWNRLYLIAATRLAGDVRGAADLYQTYQGLWPRRTVWQLSSYDTKAETKLTGYSAYLSALHDAGMPNFVDETEDDSVAPSPSPLHLGAFDPTPLSLPGGIRIDTKTLAAMLSTKPEPLILDVGSGAAVIPGATLVWPQDSRTGAEQLLLNASAKRRAPGASIVVMADGPLGSDSYDAAQELIARHIGPVLWYRGGEQGWVAGGHPFEDLRVQ